jgi:hypothetical protein
MPRRLLAITLFTLLGTGPVIAQLPQGGPGFSDSIFKAQAPAAPAPALDPQPAQPPGGAVGTLTGEPPPRKIWSGGLEAGINGQDGNTNVINFRTGWNATRKVDDNLYTMDFLYAFAKQEGIETQNQALFNARDEFLFPGSPWSLFASTNIEYDKFRAYDFLIGVYAGVGYTVLETDRTLFKLRAGAGAVRRFGGPDEKWIPELLFGYDFNHKIDDRQSFIHTLDYYPQIDKFTQFRLRARAAYEIIVDPVTGTALRLGVQTRYDSNPGPGIRRNDLNYFATLMVKF